ncbi:terminase large subunit domain-containing protein [Caldalkalibacillus horti]|uniref:DNA packaging protein n=1 Tax=Caldalkalibacillus horti TaxID=77523 RepID=A0ABT9W4P7_9BACI|nr:terminase family protein [Bacillus horti]MDQ0168213.1 hypothetical protein [Bacillus horti]
MARTKQLSKKEKLQIIISDFKKYAKNFLKIIDNNGDLIQFELNDQQNEFVDGMTKFNIISKARQGGFSTLSLGLCLFYALTKPNTNYLIVSYKGDSSSALFERLKMMNTYLQRDKYPSLFPAVKRDNRNELLFDNGSRITCIVAGNKDVGRGSTYEYILLSEYAFYQNQEKVLLSAEQSLAKNENSRVVIETTSNGFNNYQKVFMKAYKGQGSKYKAFFVPFYASLYKIQFKHEHDEAEKWYRSENKGKRLQAKDLEPDEKVLYDKGANLRFLMWRRWKLTDMSLQEFYQEYPSNPMESFISTGQSVFDQSKVLERLNYVIDPLATNEVYDELPEVLRAFINRGLYIYHLPKRGRYYAGCDSASGSGGSNDASSISIFNSEGQQVASFYSNKVPIYKFAEIVDALGRYYYQAFLCVERNSYGLPVIERLRKEYQYMNLYKQKLFDMKGKRKLQLGWTTTAANKSILISDYKEQFECGMINLECKETLQQMQIFQESDGKMGNKKGENNHDDLVISSALAIQGMKTGKWYVDVA